MSLPETWQQVQLGDLIECIEAGKNMRCEERPPEPHEQGIIKISSVTWGTFDPSEAKTALPGTHLPPGMLIWDGDLLMSRANTLELVGATVVVDHAPGNLYLSDKVLRLRTTPDLARWLNLFLRTAEGRREIETRATGNQLSMRNIGQEAIRSIEIPLAPLPEQRRIVAQIEALFARIRRARADLERVAPLARHHRDRTLATAFAEDWPEANVIEVAETAFDGPFGSNLKSNDYTTAGTRVVRLENIGHLQFIAEKETFIRDEKAASLARHRLKAGDVLFSSFVDKEVRVCLFPADLPTAAINKADCFCIRADDSRIDPRFLALRLASPVTYDEMRDAVHGATRPRIGMTDLKGYRIGVPPREEQSDIVSRIEHAHTSTKLTEHESTRALALLDRLEQSILARAFRGELVPQDPQDEPASALLARLRSAPAAAPRRGRARAAAAG